MCSMSTHICPLCGYESRSDTLCPECGLSIYEANRRVIVRSHINAILAVVLWLVVPAGCLLAYMLYAPSHMRSSIRFIGLITVALSFMIALLRYNVVRGKPVRHSVVIDALLAVIYGLIVGVGLYSAIPISLVLPVIGAPLWLLVQFGITIGYSCAVAIYYCTLKP